MTLLLDRRRLIVSPALAPAQLRETDQFDRGQEAADGVLTIGLVNNMPDSALQPTERQFMRLLTAAAGNHRIRFHCFSLPSVNRSQPAKWRVDQKYTDIAELDRLHIDGLIVTGAEPNAATLPEEPFWQDLTDLIDWAKTNTRSTIWSCLAAHAAVLHLDGIERRRLDEKCSGTYDCFPRKVASISSSSNCRASSSSFRDTLNMIRYRWSGNTCATSPAFLPASAPIILPSLSAISIPRPNRGSPILNGARGSNDGRH
jgi:homoserine O-succinyltransferase